MLKKEGVHNAKVLLCCSTGVTKIKAAKSGNTERMFKYLKLPIK